MDPSQDFQLIVELSCDRDRSKRSQTKTLSFDKVPSSCKEIKEKVEECFSVPACVQTVRYNSEELPDDCELSSLYMRSGDAIRITFPEKGECDNVKLVIQWLTDVIPILQKCINADKAMLEEICGQHSFLLGDEEAAGMLSRKIFYPWTDRVKKINCLHFVNLNGVELLVTFHRHAIELRKSNDYEFARYLSTYYEVICSQAVANFAMDFTCRRLLSRGDGLEQCIQSFLIKPAEDDSLLFNHSYSIVDVALYAVCNISEIPEVQHWISQKKDVIEQALVVAKSSRYTCNTATMAVSLLLCLAQTPDAHVNLLKPDIVEQLVDACITRRLELAASDKDEEDEVMALECYAAVVLSQIICGSHGLLRSFPPNILESMSSFINRVLTYDSDTIRDYEIKQGLVWGTFLPYLTFLYSPEPDTDNSSMLIADLYHCAVDVLLQCLENALGREDHVKTLVEEELVDFVVALTWTVSFKSQERALRVYREVTKFQQVQPPSLTSLAKAKLAKLKYGLKKMREMESMSHLLNSVSLC